MEAVKKCIERLQGHFENFELRPAASAEQLKEANDFFTDMNEEIIGFYQFCDGFDCHITDIGSDGSGRIYSMEMVHEQLGYMKQYGDNALYSGLFPIKDDGCGNMDFLWLHKDMAQGCVVFWDHETEAKPEYLLGGSFVNYLKFLTDHLITCYHPNGDIKFDYDIDNPDIVDYPWPFDSDWMATQDPELKRIKEDEEYSTLFNV